MKKVPNKNVNKGRLIQFQDKDAAINGFGVLLHNGQVAAYADNTYAVGEEHLKLLQEAGIPYKVLRE